MMYGWGGGGWGPGWWIVMVIAMMIVWAIVVFGIVMLIRYSAHRDSPAAEVLRRSRRPRPWSINQRLMPRVIRRPDHPKRAPSPLVRRRFRQTGATSLAIRSHHVADVRRTRRIGVHHVS